MRLLTRLEAMEYLGVKSPATFKKYERNGMIKSLKSCKQSVTTRKRYCETDLDKVFR